MILGVEHVRVVEFVLGSIDVWGQRAVDEVV